jgi:CBS domain containing-hemolysin-like protein
MFTLSVVVVSLLVVILLLVASVYPPQSGLSLFELNRRVEAGDKRIESKLIRERYRGNIMSLFDVKVSLLLVSVALIGVAGFGWGWGIVITILVGLSFKSISNIGMLRKITIKLYAKVEKTLLDMFQKYPIMSRLFAAPKLETIEKIGSREELQHLVDESDGILSDDEKKLVTNGLSFSNRKVSEIMVLRDKIVTIEKREFLGPLVLNDLHKLGFKRLPVISDDIDHIIGILNLRGLLELDVKRSVTAEKAMEPKVFYIREDKKLDQAMATFLKTHTNLLIVINKERKTVGLLTFEDLMSSLLGRRVVDNFDEHDNLHAVAKG